ncbi:MAG: hypothetical protein P8K80_08010 [Phycisphaerales bacterium]|nr:hypothetical protein [Phycisphaerales bacterium]
MTSFTILCIALGTLATDLVVPRGGGDPMQGSISRLDEDGVRIKVEGATPVVLSWDRISDVQSKDDRFPRLEQFLEQGARLWRARTRLERGDTELAEPIFEVLFPGTIGRTSETALVVAEGLLRCRLKRGELDAALLPALEVSRLRRLGIKTDSYAQLLPPSIGGESPGLIHLVDVDAGLVPYLPPAWIRGPALASRIPATESWDAGDDESLALLSSLYGRSIRQSMGEKIDPVDLEDEVILESSGALLLGRMINALHQDDVVRKSARADLEAMLATDPDPWVESWIRFQLGRSLLMEPGMGQQRRGLLSLSHVPARWGQAQPYLSGVAMAIMADQFDAHDDVDAARRMRTDLRRMHPAHPVLRRGVEGMATLPEKETP